MNFSNSSYYVIGPLFIFSATVNTDVINNVVNRAGEN